MSGSGFFASPAYKKIMSKVYGFGASVVIMGALFKILHWPGANFMLIAGLGTESLIFFLSAFEPPHEMPDWSLVYPELVGLEPRETRSLGGGGGGGSELAALVQSGNIDVSTVEKLSEGIKKLSHTASSLSDISDASMATEAYLQAMKTASNKVGEFSNTQSQLGSSAETLSNSFINTAKAVSDSGAQFSDNLTKSGDSFVDTLNESGERLISAYQTLGETMANQVEKTTADSIKYTEELSKANQQLSAINSIYELQLSSINEQVQSSQKLTKSLDEISKQMEESVPDTRTYKQEVANLTKTLGELNVIYGNMLSAMSVGGNK